MKVLICGGGCAGPALAFWLARLGHQVTVLERFPALRASGAQIDLRDKGIEVTKRMGLLPAIREKRVDEAGVSIVDEKGTAWATILANKTGKGPQGPTSEYEIMRGDLVRILYDATKDDVEYVFGKSVSSYEQNYDQGTVSVHFSDGSSDTYDLLVGADGQGSRIRKAMIPDGVDPYLRTGLHVSYWFMPRIESDTNMRETYHCTGSRQLMRRTHNSTESQAYFILRDEDPSIRAIHRAPEAEQKKFWKQRFHDAGWQTGRFIKEMDKTDNFYSAEVLQVRLDKWHQGRVVLLGDAAYCPSPLSGMGTTNGFVGAYVLAGELSKVSDDLSLEEALKNYDTTLRPFVSQTQDVNFRLMKLLTPKTAWGISVLRWTMWLVCLFRVPQLVTRFSSEEKGTWQLPEYPQMVGKI